MPIRKLTHAVLLSAFVVSALAVPAVARGQTARLASAAERALVRRAWSRAVGNRVTSRTVVRRAESRALPALARDLRNHNVGKVVKLPASRTVARYTTLSRARVELGRGVPPMRHLTSRGGAGRPLSGTSAARVLGLARKPAARLTVRVPKGQPVILNRIPGGAPGRGELVSPKRIPASAVKRIVAIKK